MSGLTCNNVSLSLSGSLDDNMNIDYKPFDTVGCNCFFCQVGVIEKTTTPAPTPTKKKVTTIEKKTKPQTKPTGITRYRKKFFTMQDKFYARDDVEYQLNMANYDAKTKNTKKVQGHLGPNGEYFYIYEWSEQSYDDIWTLNLIELCDLSQTPEYREYRRNQRLVQHLQPRRNFSAKMRDDQQELDSPIPVLIAFEKMASDHGRRLRLVDVTDVELFNFFVKHRYYSVQSDDSNCLIDK